MSQSRRMSMVEAVTNVAVGFLLALVVQLVAFPVLGLQASLRQSLALSGAFTAISLARSYLLRRLFLRIGPREAIEATSSEARRAPVP